MLTSVAFGYSDAKVGDNPGRAVRVSASSVVRSGRLGRRRRSGFLALNRRNGLARSAVMGQGRTLAQLDDFLLLRYEDDIYQ
jgi:hypothetical protein